MGLLLTLNSPDDQAILEAAYSHDPKPDKNARLELVKRVALGEKEVQVCPYQFVHCVLHVVD